MSNVYYKWKLQATLQVKLGSVLAEREVKEQWEAHANEVGEEFWEQSNWPVSLELEEIIKDGIIQRSMKDDFEMLRVLQTHI